MTLGFALSALDSSIEICHSFDPGAPGCFVLRHCNVGGQDVDIRNINQVGAFVTKDGSEIRELLAHRNSCIAKQSLAEARLAPGQQTTPHFHRQTEEIYYILTGHGLMKIGEEQQAVGPGDAIAIPPMQPHTITNTGTETLTFLCCCAPAYEHEDTVLLEGRPE